MTEANLLMSGKAQSAAPTLTDGLAYPLSMTTDARVRADVAGTVAVSGTVPVSGTVTTTGTATTTPVTGSPYALTTAANTNPVSIKAGAGQVFEVSVFNSTASTIYVRLYNKVSAPTVGTDIPIVVIPVTTGALANIAFGQLGKRFSTGIALAVTGASGNTDATAVSAGALISATYL